MTNPEIYQSDDDIVLALNALEISRLHLTSANGTDIHLRLGEQRRWASDSAGSEIFTSPDWRGTNGTLKPNQPIPTAEGPVEDITLTFLYGQVLSTAAKRNGEYLEHLAELPNIDIHKVGRIGLSRGLLTLTLGASNIGAYVGDASEMTRRDWERLAFTDPECPLQEEFVLDSESVVTAKLASGQERVIYQNGEFTV